MADKKISDLTAATAPLAGTEVLPIVQSSSTKKVAVNDLTVKNVRSNATTGLLQVAGPTTGTTRVMTTPDANFTVARTDAAQTFVGTQSFYEIDIVGATKTYISYVDATGNLYVVRYVTGGGYEGFPFEIAVNSDIKARAGNFVIGTAGKGIDFSANTGAAGMTSELLTRYEEGTWTPVITSTTGAITSYTVYTATYTRIGRVVHIVLQFAVTDNGTGAGALSIAGLPFAAAAATCGMTYNQSTGESGTFTVATSATSGSSVKYNNAYPVATGQTLQFNLTYSA
jgi:hypothetical protein